MRRHVIIWVVLLLIGMLLNLAVAYGYCLHQSTYLSLEKPITTGSWITDCGHNIPGGTTEQFGREFGIERHFYFAFYVAQEDNQRHIFFARLTRIGFPFLSFKGGSVHESARDEDFIRSIELPKNMLLSLEDRYIPVFPIVLGFAGNTLFYAWIAYVVWSFPSIIRRVIRTRRGQCLSCGYDLRGLKHERCPECGNSLD